MRRFIAAVTALLITLGLALVVIGSADAAITAPAAGTAVGTITVTSTGASNAGYYTGLFGTGYGALLGNAGCTTSKNSSLVDRVDLVGPGSTATTVLASPIALTGSAAEQHWNNAANGVGTGTYPKNGSLDTRGFANGTYRLRESLTNLNQGGAFSYTCTTVAAAATFVTIDIENKTNVAYTSGTSTAPQNTSIPVSALVTDPNQSDAPVANIPVTFALTGGGTVTATSGPNGVANANLLVAGAPRSATLSVTSGNTAFYNGSTVQSAFTVTKDSSTTTLSAPSTLIYGNASSFTATIGGLAATGTPTGTVQFTVDGSNAGSPVTLVLGVATSAPSVLSPGGHTIGAIYSGSTDYLSSTATTKTQQINKVDTNVALNDSPAPSKYGQATVFTAMVSGTDQGPGAVGLTGAVQFNVDGQPFGTAVPLTGTTATLTISNLDVGNHPVTAVYSGDVNYKTGTSAQIVHAVGLGDTNVALTSSDSAAVSGEPLTFTANVTSVAPTTGIPGGQVQFSIDGAPLGGPVTLANGQAVSPVVNLAYQAGGHMVTAVYSGTSNYGGSNKTITQVIAAAETATTVTSSPNPSVFGQPVQVHSEVTPVSPATGHPLGFVQFIVDGANYSFKPLTGGAAEATLTGLSVGSHNVEAVYLSSDHNFFTSTSPTISQVVNKAATTTALTSDSPTSVFGQPVTFTASISVTAPGAGSPSGTIVFKDGTSVIGTQPVSSATGEQASITTGGLSVGSHAISASYSGDGNFLASAGNASQTVIRAQTSTELASSVNPAASGQGVQFTATVTPVAPGAGTPTGTVTFFVNGANLGPAVPVASDGTASSSMFASLSPGTYAITSVYSGDGNFVGSNGVLDQGTGQNITKGSSTTTVTSGPSPSAYGSPVTVTSTVVGGAPAAGKPTGVVQVYEGDVLLGSTSLVPQPAANTSVATFVTTDLAPGAHPLTATYVGNFNFDGSTGTASQSVGKESTVTGISSSGSPAVYGDTVTYTANVTAASGTPTGTITFKEGSTVLGTAPVAGVGGNRQASLAVSGQHTGAHAITASYSGDTAFGASSSAAFNQQITAAPTTIFAADVNNPGPLAPKSGYIRAKLLDRYGNPMSGRTITFTSTAGQARPAKFLCTAVTGADGIAECNDQVISIDIGLAPGDTLLDIHGTYDVTYSGDADTIGSTARGHEY